VNRRNSTKPNGKGRVNRVENKKYGWGIENLTGEGGGVGGLSWDRKDREKH
jgi:hypothetical protein